MKWDDLLATWRIVIGTEVGCAVNHAGRQLKREEAKQDGGL